MTMSAPTSAAWAVQMKAQAAARVVQEACEKARIQPLFVKGVVTSRLLYEDVAERPMMDVDVRVRPKDLESTLVALAPHGRLVRRIRAYRSFIVDIGGMHIDVESHIGPPGLCDLGVDAMLARAEQSTLLGFPHLVPELHDHALLLFVNVFKDKLPLAREGPMEDVRRIVAQKSFRADILATRARETHSETLAWLVADYMHWEEGLRALPKPKRVLYTDLIQHLEKAETSPRGTPGSFALRLMSRTANDRASARIHALFWMAIWAAERLGRGESL